MATPEVMTFIAIHIIVPIIGVVVYLLLAKKLLVNGMEMKYVVMLGVIFATYGGLLLVILTSLFWLWSGMASLGIGYLLLLAPVIMIIIGVLSYKRRRDSVDYRYIYIPAFSYPFFLIISTLLLLSTFS